MQEFFLIRILPKEFSLTRILLSMNSPSQEFFKKNSPSQEFSFTRILPYKNSPSQEFLTRVIIHKNSLQELSFTRILYKSYHSQEFFPRVIIHKNSPLQEFSFRKEFTPLLFAAVRQRKIMMVFQLYVPLHPPIYLHLIFENIQLEISSLINLILVLSGLCHI